jgi:hypothetical protein
LFAAVIAVLMMYVPSDAAADATVNCRGIAVGESS